MSIKNWELKFNGKKKEEGEKEKEKVSWESQFRKLYRDLSRQEEILKRRIQKWQEGKSKASVWTIRKYEIRLGEIKRVKQIIGRALRKRKFRLG